MAEKKTIILGVTAGIAIYKAADLCSKLSKKYNVIVIMTANAQKLMSTRIFFTLSGNPVLTDIFAAPEWKPAHIALAQRASLFVVAPCTANFIGKFTHGIADDALTTTIYAFRKKVLLAPAMNNDMLENPAYIDNVEILKKRGVHFIGPETGHLACGTEGNGRMSEPEQIVAAIDELLKDE